MESTVVITNKLAPKYTYQLNAHFGFFFSDENRDDVINTLSESKDKRYRKLAVDNNGSNGHEISLGKDAGHICIGTNTDNENVGSIGFIYVDEMSIIGDEFDFAEEIDLNVYPDELLKLHSKHKAAVRFIEEISTYITSEFKKRKLPRDEFYVGWKMIACSYADSESSESS